ncbi:putative toxin-antitoxin system toxin component, PIN family [uncultured Ralstonia sp.]|uniref:putative toxin-antitoxin system toxin component, PIN family n=1 Tax=Ralstonia sp. TaxID=54061 RepID=UPI001EA79D08|nr:putative toxin-antitoxin system toxin component, PIN family [uncultured Ralstonia sp.]UCF23192.1 MAG: putative toxin-antitoxin system toxin component, PIN family [Ralstonia sp.]
MADAAALAASAQPPAPPQCPRVVLDSNIWVDILIFDDAVARPIRAALEAGRLQAIISPACREELRRVLDYPQFARYAIDAEAALAWVDRMTHSVPDPEATPRAEGEAFVPVCKDRDDQKFLALADAARVAYLVSKDRAVLKLKRRMAKYCDVAVLPPKQFVALVQLETAPLVQA